MNHTVDKYNNGSCRSGIFVGTSSQGSTTCDALPAFEPTAPTYSSERSLESIESGDESASEGEREAFKQIDAQLARGPARCATEHRPRGYGAAEGCPVAPINGSEVPERRVSFNDKPQTIAFVGTSWAGAATCDALPGMDVGAENLRYSKSHLEQINAKVGMYEAEKPEKPQPSALAQKVSHFMPSMFSKSFLGGQKQ